MILYFDEQGKTLAVRLSPENQTQVGEKVSLYFDMEKAHVFDPETKKIFLCHEFMSRKSLSTGRSACR